MTKKNEFDVIKNYNYTITLRDKRGRELNFRDICGNDLEFLEKIFETNEEGEETRRISFDNLVSILELINTNSVDFKNFPQRITVKIFQVIQENILINYMPKYDWLIRCFSIQDGSFCGVSEMEKVPMTKFIAMCQIHKDAIELIKNDN